MLVHESAAAVIRASDFPTEWQHGGGCSRWTTLRAGRADGGVTVDIPVATLNTVAAEDFTWPVPGLRHDLVVALIRSLPKKLRVNFVPAPNVARDFLAADHAGEEPMLDALERFLRGTGVVVPRDAWDLDKVPGHLRLSFRVGDDDGRAYLPPARTSRP